MGETRREFQVCFKKGSDEKVLAKLEEGERTPWCIS